MLLFETLGHHVVYFDKLISALKSVCTKCVRRNPKGESLKDLFLKAMSTRSRTSFGFLEQILEEEETSDEQYRDPNASSGAEVDSTDKTDNECRPENKTDKKRNKANSGPSGVYPVRFSTLRNKSCQTRLSTFPMFPINDFEATVWISDSEGKTNKQNKLTSKIFPRKKGIKSNKYEQRKDPEEHLRSKYLVTRNEDGTRKEFSTEHQLKRSKNPVLLAWLHQKNKLLKQKKRVERREKREKRFALHEERRRREERVIESERKVREWMLMKKRQLAKTFSLTLRAAKAFETTKISPDNEEKTTEKRVPSNYRVVRSFQYQCPPDEANDTAKSKCNVQQNARRQQNDNQNKIIPDIDHSSGNGISGKTKPRLVSAKSQRFQKQELEDSGKSERPKTAFMRPKTAPSGGKNDSPVATHKMQKTQTSPPKMQSMTYQEWLKYKRKEDRKQQFEQKKESIDSHLDKVISELGKERVRKIREGKKQVDTGLKNLKRTPDPMSASSPKANSNSYKPSRPKSAWPMIGESGNGIVPKEAKNINHQMGNLDLNDKSSEEVAKRSNKPETASGTTSTVREDFFDYGSEVETASLRRNGFVNNRSPSQSRDFQIM